MTPVQHLVAACAVMVGLTFVVGLRMFRVRVGEMMARRIDPQSVALSAQRERRLEDSRASDNFNHLFELPVLFYALVVLIVVVLRLVRVPRPAHQPPRRGSASEGLAAATKEQHVLRGRAHGRHPSAPPAGRGPPSHGRRSVIPEVPLMNTCPSTTVSQLPEPTSTRHCSDPVRTSSPRARYP